MIITPSKGDCVTVTNNLTSHLTVIAHCRSADDDLRAQLIRARMNMRWSFAPRVLGTTLFWCDITVQDKRLSFAAYDASRDMKHFTYTSYVYGMIMDDEVHSKYLDEFDQTTTTQEFQFVPWN
ncbi:S-protein homolog 3 [Linum perenne]